MAVHTANAVWQGNLKEGQGQMAVGSGAYEGQYSYTTRFEEGKGTNPEELIGAAHAGCYSMALSMLLAQDGHTPERVDTKAKVNLRQVDGSPTITSIDLTTEAKVPGLDKATFQQKAEAAKEDCVVSRALAGTTINLKASLV